MTQLVALVDYDNQRTGRFRGLQAGGISLNYRDHEDFIGGLARQLLAYRENDRRERKELLELRIRLYGGWTDLDGRTTNLADMVLKAIRQHGRSQRIRATRILIDLADCPLYASGTPFAGTLRPVAWSSALRSVADRPMNCISPGSPCAQMETALLWARGRCPAYPACPVRRDEAFAFEGQKMVDTMIVADAIFAHVSGAIDVIAVSADDDVVPGLLAVSALGGTATLMRFGMRNIGRLDTLLRGGGVRIVDYPAIG